MVQPNGNQTLTIEKTPHYFIDRSTPLRMFQTLPKVKLIVILRDPIIRAISDYVQLKSHHRFYPSFDKIIDSENFTRWKPIQIGCYARHVRRWLKYFPLEQIHFVDGENLIRRPWEELKFVQTFLNVTQQISEDNFYFNPKKFFFPCLRQTNGCLGSNKGRIHPIISDRTREKLKKFYSNCNGSLKRIAKIHFPWIE